MIQAVIFDMDGVLIDSEIVYIHHQYNFFHPKYPWVTMETLYPTVGMGADDGIHYLAQLLHRDLQDPDFLAEIDTLFHSCTVDYTTILRPEVPALLRTLRQMGLQRALASSSSIENIRHVLTLCGLTDCFDFVISGEQFRKNKPDPEVYLHTMALLNRRPEECLIIEDSTYGIQAGCAAGGLVAALRDERFPFDQSAAQLSIGGLGEIPALVQQLRSSAQSAQ